MATPRRSLSTALTWMKKNRPSGVLSGWMIFFVVSYIIIVKLDSYGRDTTQSTQVTRKPIPHDTLRFRTHKAPPSYGNERTNPQSNIKEIMADFERDRGESGRNADRLYGGTEPPSSDEDEPVIDLSNVSDNELMLFHDMEGKQDEIDENWKNYLNKDKNVMNTNINSDKHLRFQGVHNRQSGESKKRILPKLPLHVHVFDALSEDKKFRDAVSDNKCVLLKTLHGDSPICVHDPDDDEIISSKLVAHGAWEPNFLYITGSILKLEPDLVFLDLGCNIGVYTILAAKLGTPVVAVDPNRQNLRLLTKSLSLGNIRDKVTLLRNAISDKHENVSLIGIVGNVGGTYVEPTDGNNNDDEVLETVILDDLVEVFQHKAVFIKMDIETYELKALRGATKFFEEVDVRYILMEWIAHRGSDTAADIIKFLTKRDIYPHVNNHHNTKLEPEHSHTWPDNVMWIKY